MPVKQKINLHIISHRPCIKCSFRKIGSQVNKDGREEIEIYKCLESVSVIGKVERIQQLCGSFHKPEMKFVIFRGENKSGFDLYLTALAATADL